MPCMEQCECHLYGVACVKLQAVLIVLPNIVAIQWFQTALFRLRLFRLSNILLGLVSTPVAVNCVPYIAADTLCFVLDSYGCLCCLLLLKFVVRYTAMCGVVMLNYGVRLESSCLVGCICCVLPLHL